MVAMSTRDAITGQLLDAYGVVHRLQHAGAVVLERIARGGGDTRWYCCDNVAALASIRGRFSPGSVVSFHFDDRMKCCVARDLPLDEIDAIIARDGECIVGRVGHDGIDIEAFDLCSSTEIAEEFPDLRDDERLVYGPFPARSCDGWNAITFILPDDDGVFRAHPH